MNYRSVSLAVLGLTWMSLLAATGCNTTYGPRFGIFGYPVPLTPYLQNMQEERFWEQERYAKVPILEPFTPGGPTTSLDAPSDDEVMLTLEKARPLEGGFPFFHEIQRNNVRIVKDLISDSVDPVRVMPLVGPVQLHHARYRCSVYFSEVTRVGWPIPYTTKNEDAQEVLYIDHSHLHMVGNVDPGMGGPPVTTPAAAPIPSPTTGQVAPPASRATSGRTPPASFRFTNPGSGPMAANPAGGPM